MQEVKSKLKNQNSKIQVKSVKVESKVVKSTTLRTPKASGLSVPVYSLTGRTTGQMTLPKEIFGAKVNKVLLAQAIRVYANNQKTHPGSTKTRGEVTGSTAKVWRQKGTGRARHGGIRAPIFVGGGITFGPKPRKVKLSLPKKMKKAALISALSSKMAEKQISGVSGLEKVTGKTKEMAKFWGKVGGKSTLIVTPEKLEKVLRAVRNIPKVSALAASQLNAYEVLKHQIILLTKDSIASLQNDKKGMPK